MKTKDVPPAIAYSYLRFSSPEQSTGDSTRRQEAGSIAWCKRNGIALDATLKDEGVSAYRGAHRAAENADTHKLAGFLRAVDAGKVKPGSLLILESLDRLTREDIIPAVNLFTSLLMRGIKIVQLQPVEHIYTDKDDMTAVMLALVELSRGNSESKLKSERVGATWARKQREAGTKAITRRVPVWIIAVGGEGKKMKDTVPGEVRYELDPSKAAVVRRIFALTIDGAGAFSIARRLNAENVPYIGRKVMKGNPVAWNRTLVYQIITSTAAIGAYTPYKCRTKGRKSPGEPVANYFPAVVDEATFYQAQEAIATRAKLGRGRRGRYVNLLAGLLRDARDGGPMTYNNRPHNPIVIPQNAIEAGNAKWVSFSATCLEQAILAKMKELTAKDVADVDTDAAKKLKSAEGRVAKIAALRAAWQAKMDDVRIIDVVAAKLAELEEEYRDASAERDAARREMTNPAGSALEEIHTLADVLASDNSDEMRLKIRSALRSVVASIHLLIRSARRGERTRCAAARVQFRGKHRDYIIVTRHPRSEKEATWQAETFPALDGLDLRQRSHAQKALGLLERLDVAKFGG